ncbi:Longin-like domain-containing protein [Phyllosticta citrichinensis]|uniref:Coatomer subunit zeta n=1 Tax=Phyllosticta citrichinensis TaxID=1130410 RepID=A0ABR1XGF3_9PEZI
MALSLYSVNAILILAKDNASRILAKYYDAPHKPSGTKDRSYPGANPYPNVKDQNAFEEKLHNQTASQADKCDIMLCDNRLVVFKQCQDVICYVVGDVSENEMLLYSVVLALRDSLLKLLKGSLDKRTILEHFDMVALAVDEIVDDGIILETDPGAIAARVSQPPVVDIDISEQGLIAGVKAALSFGKKAFSQYG